MLNNALLFCFFFLFPLSTPCTQTHGQRLRLELTQMANYIRVCGQPSKPKIGVAAYLISEQESGGGGHSFSLTDLINLTQLKKQLIDLHSQLLTHITHDCQVRITTAGQTGVSHTTRLPNRQSITVCDMISSAVCILFLVSHPIFGQ